MSWECKYLRETFCDRRQKPCNPGDAGCVLYGKFNFPLQEGAPQKTPSRKKKGPAKQAAPKK